jgi:GntR family transcriptional regulator, transcriptional repressor for pyruvate dehydrogenase complex
MLNLMIVTSQLVELEHTLHFHKPILVAIEQRNPVLASRLMAEHLTDARNLLLQNRPQGNSRHRRNYFAIGHSSPKSTRLSKR